MMNSLETIDSRARNLGIHPDTAGFQDLAHAFDLKSATIAARATLEVALERKETRATCLLRASWSNSIDRPASRFYEELFGAKPGLLDRVTAEGNDFMTDSDVLRVRCALLDEESPVTLDYGLGAGDVARPLPGRPS
jgi:hypothetical protein